MGVVLAMLIYTPFRLRPHEVTDLPNLIPLLRDSPTVGDAFMRLVERFLPDGRLNLVALAIVAGKWRLFGDEMMWWHAARFAEMGLVAWLGWTLLRALGASRLGAGAGLLMLVLSPAAAMSFMRMSIAEPTGALLLLTFGLLMIGMPARLDARPRLALIALTVILIGFLKEVLLVAVPVLTVSLLAWEGQGRRSALVIARDPRCFAVLGSLVVTAIPVAVTALRASSTGYSTYYGAEGLSLASFLMPLMAPALFFFPGGTPLGVAPLVAIAAFIVFLAAGVAELLVDRAERGRLGLLLLTVGLPVAGAVIYAAWPKYRLYYALPFQIAPAILLALGVGRLWHGSALRRGMVSAGLAVIVVSMVTHARAYVSVTDAIRSLTQETAARVGRLPEGSLVSVEVCGLPLDHFNQYAWFLKEYAISLQLRPPDTADAPCQLPDASNRTNSWRLVLADGARAQSLVHARTRTYEFKTFDLGTFRVRRDSMVVAFWPPST
jgi:hypothetical protein